MELGCDAVQGYYILPPQSIADVKQWLSRLGDNPLHHRIDALASREKMG
jgi:hypothetical protein